MTHHDDEGGVKLPSLRGSGLLSIGWTMKKSIFPYRNLYGKRHFLWSTRFKYNDVLGWPNSWAVGGPALTSLHNILVKGKKHAPDLSKKDLPCAFSKRAGGR